MNIYLRFISTAIGIIIFCGISCDMGENILRRSSSKSLIQNSIVNEVFNNQDLTRQIIYGLVDITPSRDGNRHSLFKDLRSLSLVNKSMNQLIKNLFYGNDYYANYFNERLLAHTARMIYFKNNKHPDEQSREILAAAYLGTPYAVNILQQRFRRDTIFKSKRAYRYAISGEMGISTL